MAPRRTRELAREDVRSLAARLVGVAILVMGLGLLVGGVVVTLNVNPLGGILLAALGLALLVGGLLFSLVPFRLEELRERGLAYREGLRTERRGGERRN